MKQLMLILTITILLLSNPFAAKAEDIPKVERPDLFGLMVTGTEVEVVTVGGASYECTTTYYYINGAAHVNGNKDRCFPLASSEPTPDPEPTGTTICNGCPDINISHPMRTFKNKKFRSIN